MNAMERELSDAIENGDTEKAAQLARALANGRTKLDITKAFEDQILVKVYLESMTELSNIPLEIRIRPSHTIKRLKQMILLKTGFPPEVQSVIIGNRIVQDTDTLRACGVLHEHPIYVYLQRATQVGLDWDNYVENYADMLNSDSGPQTECKVAKLFPRLPLVAPRHAGQSDDDILPPTHPSYREMEEFTPVPPKPLSSNVEDSWSCTKCTYLNKERSLVCEMCQCQRPPPQPVKRSYKRPEELIAHGNRAEIDEYVGVREAMEKSKTDHISDTEMEITRIDNASEFPPHVPFKCDICFEDVVANTGVVLRGCLHEFCRDCLKEQINTATSIPVKCPYVDQNNIANRCESDIQEREVHELLSRSDFEVYELKGLRAARVGRMQCANRSCDMFYSVKDSQALSKFTCDKCDQTTCVRCKTVHKPQETCEKFKQMEQQHKDLDGIKECLKAGLFMYCPKCSSPVSKDDEMCDLLECSQCDTQICWATKGPRWGPGGITDTSGGCKCLVDGIKCHRDCRGCH